MFKPRTILVVIAALAIVATAARAGAQDSASANGPDPMAFLAHVTNAKLLAADDLAARNLVDCSMPPENAAAAVGTVIDAPPTKVSGRDVPMPYAANLEKLALPTIDDVIEAARAVCYKN